METIEIDISDTLGHIDNQMRDIYIKEENCGQCEYFTDHN